MNATRENTDLRRVLEVRDLCVAYGAPGGGVWRGLSGASFGAGRGGCGSNGCAGASPRPWGWRIDCFSGAVAGFASDDSDRRTDRRSLAGTRHVEDARTRRARADNSGEGFLG